MIGTEGSTAAQRSELSRHRSLDAAVEAADAERDRLPLLHGDEAANYRIVVERDGEPVAEASPAPPVADEAGPGGTGELPVVAVSEGEPSAVEEEPPEGIAPASVAPDTERPPAESEEAPPAVRPAIDVDEIPEGPVPADVIARFEAAIEREERRSRERSSEK
jgi:hypothetical protein